jgi:FMN phosphatase YigB (HAD superfamily)
MVLWVVFDLDDTLLLNRPIDAHLRGSNSPVTPDEDVTIEAYVDTLRVLKFLKDRGTPIALASFRTNARDVLRNFGLLQYFDDLEFGQDNRTKVDMIHNLSRRLKLNPFDAIFFDDMPENVELCTDSLIYTVQANPHTGVTLEELFDALSAIQKQPLYVLGEANLDQSEFAAYFPDYRVSFLTCDSSSRTIDNILSVSAEYNPLIMRITGKYTIELFTPKLQLKVQGEDLYHALDALLEKYDSLENLEQSD